MAVTATLLAMLTVEAPQYYSAGWLPTSASETRFEYWFNDATQRLDAANFGTQWVRARLLYALHRMTRQDQIAAAAAESPSTPGATMNTVGLIRSRGARDLSESYGSPGSPQSPGGGSRANADSEYLTTPYGQEFLQLRATRPGSFPTVVGGL